MRRLVAGLVLALLVPLAGCGGDPEQQYCSALGAQRQQMADMLDSTSPDALLGNVSMLRDLAAKAPPDLVDEWQTFLGAVTGLQKALDHAGVKPSQYHDGKPPAGLSSADRTAVTDAAQQLSSTDVVQAAAGIEQEARDVCKINLGL